MKVPVYDRLESKNERKNGNQIGPVLQMVERGLDGVTGYLRYHGEPERYQQAGEWWNFGVAKGVRVWPENPDLTHAGGSQTSNVF